MICEIFKEGLMNVLRDSSSKLKEAFRISDSRTSTEDGSKFNIVPVSCGCINDFHAGIESRTGVPSLKFFESMETEHNNEIGFTTTNYHISTTPKAEWNAVIHGDVDPQNMKEHRRIPNIDDLMQLKVSQDSRLQRSEVIAVVLYTGPMFQLYNSILRRWPDQQYEEFRSQGNVYTTTIYVLVSAVLNLARETKIPAGTKLYRGLGGDKVFPRFFYKSDAQGRKGVLEWGFMSTTADKDVAVRYSGIREGKPFPTIFEIDCGTVDRGADITEFSQYPGERECLFAPCSFLEPLGDEAIEVTSTGVVGRLRLRLNANLKARNLSELEGQKKQMHLASFKYLLDELERQLVEMASGPEAKRKSDLYDPYTKADFGTTSVQYAAKIVKQTREVLAHEHLPAVDFVDDDVYRSLVAESLEVRDMGKEKFFLWMRGPHNNWAIDLKDRSLKACHREWNMYQEGQLSNVDGDERASLALEICKSKGLLRKDVNERNTFGETPILAAAADGERALHIELLGWAQADLAAANTEGQTALHLAAKYGHINVVRALARFGPDPSLRDGNGCTALWLAAWFGHDEVIRMLVDLRADPGALNKCRESPGFVAARNGHITTLRLLHELGVNLCLPDCNGLTPAGAADYQRQVHALKELSRLGVDVSVLRV
mmetsp:Transcript_42079/g.87924  ORF Transcript_42079/g.87924 Transcript_42079/m.87924 type:complete len:657 (-) Transcript_42079:439-2409(-)|eukprot:CAMPEP_0172160224 /NCGR_PEP_ID=MMETSP1050-20130122/5439_1 /TAXON_ID=233186 /ORGANISM="Cryptomonas curvata, Strain CCAP979/52" /LENGTH=656 /DNA_ID=CAMNT_0012829963 /DNA_START=668 /DNA_END=2638 /DNA_ORIENTATION=+